MKPRILLTLLTLLFIAAPAGAQSKDFVADFLGKYRPVPEKAAAPPANPPSAMAQFLQSGEVPITLNDVVNMMVDQNLDIQSNRYTPRSSALQTLVFYRVLQPSLTVNVTLANNSSFSTSQLNGASSLGLLQNNFSVSYAKNLKWGTTVGVATTMARSKSNNAFSTFNPSYVGKITYSISQHLMRDRGSIVNLRQVYQAQNSEKISESQFEIQLTNLLVTAQKAYWDLVFSERDLQVKQASLELAKKTLEENKQKVDIGTMARIDVVQTQLDVAQRGDVVVGATGTVTQAQDQIKKLISNSNDSSLFMIRLKAMESPRPPRPNEIPELKDALAVAFENRPEIRQAMLDLKNKDLDVQYTKNQKSPSLDVSANFSQNGTGGEGLLVFTAPTTATYYMRVASYQGGATGGYRVLTTTNFPQNDRARDHRDVFCKWSDGGTTWGPTVRVNDSPGYFDDWLPEVTVDGVGRVFMADFDWRDATSTCGGGSNIYLYRSDDGGSTWIPGSRMTDVTTNWTDTYSTLLPNQGDYIGLTARDSTVFLAWADGRDADPTDASTLLDPDVYMTATTLSCQAAPVALVGTTVYSDTIVVTWSAPQGFQATLSRRVDAGAFVDIGPVTADASDQIVYVDLDVAPGHTYTYRLGVTGFCQTFAGTTSATVPGPPVLPFGITMIRPNPSRHDVFVELQRRGTAPAYLELLDITGRQIHKMEVPCPAGLFCAVNITQNISVKPGLYFVRLSEGSDESVKRVSIFP